MAQSETVVNPLKPLLRSFEQFSDIPALDGRLARRLGRAGLGAVLDPPLAEHLSLLRVRLGSAGRDTSADGSRGDRTRAKNRGA